MLTADQIAWTIIAALVGLYLIVLLRSLFIFFFRGGRKEILEQEGAVVKALDRGDNSTPAGLQPEPKKPPTSPKKTLRFLA